MLLVVVKLNPFNLMILGNKNKLLSQIPIVILALIGAISIFLLTSRNGASVSPDSVAYISVARHISDGMGFVNYDGYFFVLQPPLYPFLLAAVKKIFLLDPLISAGYLNAIFFGLIIYYSGLFLLKLLKSLPLTIIGTASILVSFVFIQIMLLALSEPLFILLVLLYLYYFDIYKSEKTIVSLLLFSSAAALACLTRYVGVIIILTGSISIFLWGSKTIKVMFRHLIIFLLITILPTAFWILRNYFLSGTFVGHRAKSSYTFTENLIFSFNTMLKWFSPVQMNGQQLLFLSLVVCGGIIAGIIFMNRAKEDELKLKQIGPALLFVIFYSGIIIISSTTTAYDKIANRLLSPVFVPLLFIIFLILDHILTRLSKYFHRRFLSIVFLVGVMFWMRYHVTRTIYNIEEYIEDSGGEYSGKVWKDNSVIRYLNNHKKLESEYSFYSNAPEAVYILANIDTKWSPSKTMYNSPQLLNTNPAIIDIYNEKNKVCLVWFNNMDRNFLFTIDELQKSRPIVKVVQLKDGEIYTFAKQ